MIAFVLLCAAAKKKKEELPLPSSMSKNAPKNSVSKSHLPPLMVYHNGNHIDGKCLYFPRDFPLDFHLNFTKKAFTTIVISRLFRGAFFFLLSWLWKNQITMHVHVF